MLLYFVTGVEQLICKICKYLSAGDVTIFQMFVTFREYLFIVFLCYMLFGRFVTLLNQGL